MSEVLRVEETGDVVVLTLNRPHARNAVNLELCLALTRTFERLDAEAPGAVVIRAEGPAFCAGADLKERRGKDADWIRRRRLASFAAYRSIVRCRVPVVAHLHGAVVGSGGEIALSCDFAYAADDVTFTYPEVHWGTIGATQRLQRVVGPKKAKELLFTAATLGAHEALEIGLVQRVLPPGESWDAVLSAARHIASAPPSAMRLTKQAVDSGAEVTLEQGIDQELRAIETNLAQGEWSRGLERFEQRERGRGADGAREEDAS